MISSGKALTVKPSGIQKLQLWEEFCTREKIFSQGVPLFAALDGYVQTIPYGKDQRPVLERSAEMEALVVREVKKVIADFEAGTDDFEGLIYMMYRKEGASIVPLYIGKSEKYGKSGNLSTNIKNIESNRSYFSRWGYNYAYHLGDLSAVVCAGHPRPARTSKYHRWAEELFEDFPAERPRLKTQVFFWMKAWEKGSVGIWEDFGSTSLTFLEYLLIGVASAAFPGTLLNSEGVNRGM